jgi:hypothetical protein
LLSWIIIKPRANIPQVRYALTLNQAGTPKTSLIFLSDISFSL